MPNPNNNNAPATVGEVVKLLFPCTDDCVRNREEIKKIGMYSPGGHMDPECDAAQHKAWRILNSFIEQLRIPDASIADRDGEWVSLAALNSKIDDMLK
mgnify:CR=1 FL=1